MKTCAVKGVPILKKKQPGICGSGQSSEPFLKEKKKLVEDASKETLDIVKEKVSKLQATIDLQDTIRKEPS